jgi:hypothetical protein
MVINEYTHFADGDGEKKSSLPAIEDSHNVLNMQTWEETKREDTE